MIQISETNKYKLNPKETIARAFEGAYVDSLEKMPQTPPDYLTAIWGCVSILVVGALYLIVAFNQNDNSLWFALSAVCVAIVAIIIYKLIKNHTAFKGASGGEDKKEIEKNKFYKLLDYDNQPEYMIATDFEKEVKPLLNKQSNPIQNIAIRKITDYIATVNNPKETSCKLLTPFGAEFNQPKKRFYMAVNGNDLHFTDFDFNNAKNEISCSLDDVVSFGEYSKYPNNILPSSIGKVRPDSIILELKDAENHLYFEFIPADIAVLKKSFGGRKENK